MTPTKSATDFIQPLRLIPRLQGWTLAEGSASFTRTIHEDRDGEKRRNLDSADSGITRTLLCRVEFWLANAEQAALDNHGRSRGLSAVCRIPTENSCCHRHSWDLRAESLAERQKFSPPSSRYGPSLPVFNTIPTPQRSAEGTWSQKELRSSTFGSER